MIFTRSTCCDRSIWTSSCGRWRFEKRYEHGTHWTILHHHPPGDWVALNAFGPRTSLTSVLEHLAGLAVLCAAGKCDAVQHAERTLIHADSR
jgi:hypothetical protein